MYQALLAKDADFEGLFWAAVTTTGIFCRPTCTARKPRPENVVFFASRREALMAGYRPCRVCRPMEPPASMPDAARALLADIEADPTLRFRDADLRARGIDPAGLRRWFRRNHGITFQGYARLLRLGAAFGRISHGETATNAAFDHGWDSVSGFADAFRKALGGAPTAVGGPLITVIRIETPLGPMLAGATEAGVCLLEFVDRRMIETQLNRLKRIFRVPILPGASSFFALLDAQLQSYFAGELREFTVPLDLKGTPFQQRVWSILRTIPYGATRSYADQARLLGDPAAIRAVARANGDNRIGIIVPCHRVVGSDGSLTGYGGGLWRKRWLLDLEQENTPSTS